jgi:hypothetical protein
VRPNPDNSFDQMFALNTGQTTETIVFDAHNLTNPQIAEYRTSALAALPPQEEYNRLVNYYYEQVVCAMITIRIIHSIQSRLGCESDSFRLGRTFVEDL